MPGEQRQSWLTSAVAAAVGTVVIVAAAAFTAVNWGMPKAQHYLDARFAAVDAKLAQRNEDALSAIKKLPSLENTGKEIEALDAKIQQTNATLTDIQKQISLAAIKAELAPLDVKLDKVNTALTAIQADLSKAGGARDAALDRIGKIVGGVKDALAGAASQTKLQDAAAKLDAVQAALTQIEKAADALKTGVTANASALDDAHKSLASLASAVKEGFAGDALSRAELKDAVGKLAQPAAPGASQPAAKKTGEDLVVFYVAPPAVAQGSAGPQQPPAPGAIPPMSLQFEKIGGLDDKGQTAVIAKKLRAIIKGRKDCKVEVNGNADTVGGDAVNHTLSRRRADVVAKKLKAAFAGEAVQITEAAWGERNLKEWTPDNTPDATNRRVDIVVRCAGE
jgi:predicted  nucleic acid-binding Zn-ribbon protein